MNRQALRRFLRYAGIGVGTLAFDLCLLYAAVRLAGVSLYIATPVSFLIAISVNYAVSRRIVFTRTKRGWKHGYVYFALVALVGAVVTTLLVASLVSLLNLNFLIARILVAGIVGFGNYLFNLYINFKVVGQHGIATSREY